MDKLLLKSSMFVAILVITGKVLAFGKDVLMSAIFGANSTTDAYFVASYISGLIAIAFYTAVSLSFLPIYNEYRLKQGVQRANSAANNAILIFSSISFVLTILGVFFANDVVQLIAPSYGPEQVKLTANVTQILCLSFSFSISCSMLGALQQSHKRFVGPQLVPILNNLFVIASIIMFHEKVGIFAVAYSSVIAWVLQLCYQLWLTRDIYKPNFNFNLKDDAIKKLSILIVPVFIGVSIDQVNVIVDVVLGTPLDEGSVSSLSYGNRLLSFGTGIFVIVVSTIMYPFFSDYVVNDNIDGLIQSVDKTLRFSILLASPVMLIASIYHYDIVEVVFGRGEFSSQSLELTALVFLCYSFSIIFIIIRESINRVFYSLKRTKYPLYSSLISIVANVILSIVLVKSFQAPGLALATSIATLVYCLAQSVFLYRIFRKTFFSRPVIFLSKISLALLVGYSSNFFILLAPFDTSILRVIVGSAVICITFFSVLYLLKVEELLILKKMGKELYLVKSEQND